MGEGSLNSILTSGTQSGGLVNSAVKGYTQGASASAAASGSIGMHCDAWKSAPTPSIPKRRVEHDNAFQWIQSHAIADVTAVADARCWCTLKIYSHLPFKALRFQIFFQTGSQST